MSDFGADPSLPPPPSGATPSPLPPPPPFGGFGAPPPAYQPVGYAPVFGSPQKAPRPAVPVGSMLLIIGGITMIVGSFLTWYKIGGEAIDGFYTDFLGNSNDGPVFVFFGVLALGFGIAQLAARRVLAVAILAVVFGALAVLVAIVDLTDMTDLRDLLGDGFSSGPGLWVILVGAAVALAGGITTLSRRRTWPTPV